MLYKTISNFLIPLVETNGLTFSLHDDNAGAHAYAQL